MAKGKITESEKEVVKTTPEAVTEKIEVSDFTAIPQKETAKKEVSLRRGEILVAELNEDGSEGKSFITNQALFDANFNNPKKFKKK